MIRKVLASVGHNPAAQPPAQQMMPFNPPQFNPANVQPPAIILPPPAPVAAPVAAPPVVEPNPPAAAPVQGPPPNPVFMVGSVDPSSPHSVKNMMLMSLGVTLPSTALLIRQKFVEHGWVNSAETMKWVYGWAQMVHAALPDTQSTATMLDNLCAWLAA